MYSFYQSGEEGLGYGENEGNIVSHLRIIQRYDAQLIFNYSREEKAAALALYEDMGKDEHIFIDIEADSLRKLVSMLETADFFFGNEGGPRHIAQACHLPGLAIYPPWIEL